MPIQANEIDSNEGGVGGSSPPFAISDISGLQSELDNKFDEPSGSSSQVLGGDGAPRSLGASDIRTAADGGFYQDTSDGSDSQFSELCGGGGSGPTRGGSVQTYGNEHASKAGQILNYCGGIAGAFWAVYNSSGVQVLKVDDLGLRPQLTGGTGHFLRQSALGGIISSSAITFADLPIHSKTRASRITSDQGSLSGTYVANTVLFNTLDVNENSAWSLSSGILTCGSALPGRWLIICNITLTGQTELLAGLWKGSNCIAQAYLNCTGVTANYQILSIVEDFANGDTLKATVALNTASGAVIARAASQATNGYSTWIECIYLGRSS